jgi:hypothetical protein
MIKGGGSPLGTMASVTCIESTFSSQTKQSISLIFSQFWYEMHVWFSLFLSLRVLVCIVQFKIDDTPSLVKK